jgi:hypothetical protein
MASLLETDDPKVLRTALFKAWEDIQELERTLTVATKLMETTAEDTIDYLDRPEPNTQPVIRKVKYMKEWARLIKNKHLSPR